MDAANVIKYDPVPIGEESPSYGSAPSNPWEDRDPVLEHKAW